MFLDCVEYTKKGEIRKRKKIKESVKSRKEKKKNETKAKHDVKQGCSINECKKQCITKINEERRKEINTMYWDLNWSEQKSFVLQSLSRSDIKRRTTTLTGARENFVRKNSFQYDLKDEIGEKQIVCKFFF